MATCVVGNAAREVLLTLAGARRLLVKRLMGRGVEDVQEELKLFPFRLAEDLAPGEVLRIQSGRAQLSPRRRFRRTFCAS